MGRSLAQGPVLALAVPLHAEERPVLRGLRGGRPQVPLAWTPPGRVFAEIRLERTAILESGRVASAWEIGATRWRVSNASGPLGPARRRWRACPRRSGTVSARAGRAPSRSARARTGRAPGSVGDRRRGAYAVAVGNARPRRALARSRRRFAGRPAVVVARPGDDGGMVRGHGQVGVVSESPRAVDRPPGSHGSRASNPRMPSWSGSVPRPSCGGGVGRRGR